MLLAVMGQRQRDARRATSAAADLKSHQCPALFDFARNYVLNQRYDVAVVNIFFLIGQLFETFEDRLQLFG